MAYIAFARKYRPESFDEVVGQPHVTTTLKNAVSTGHVSHAYIFAGPRGVGKTTTARILAKALNCAKVKNKHDPCGECPSCAEINQGLSMDVLEIDGASNRGIDEIRNLRDGIKFSPSKGKFRVYIIDEVHMLTPEAFNAILKTLEEPPPHAKFIFATTQPYKVPPTILSRCQRFDFRRITAKDIFAQIKAVVKKEKLNINDDALFLIARSSDGSMRDALVVLDQTISFTQGPVGTEDVLKILGLIDEEALFALAGAIKKKDSAGALKVIARLMDEGKDAFQAAIGLIEHFRNVLVIKAASDPAGLIDASSEKLERLKKLAAEFTIEEALYVIYTLSNALDFIRRSGMARIPLEVALVKLTSAGGMVPIGEIMERLERLDRRTIPAKLEPKAAPRPKPEPAPEPEPAPAAEPIQAAEPKDDNTEEGVEEVLSYWNGVINHISEKKISVASYLREGYPLKLEGATLTLAFPSECRFHKDALDSPDNKRLIEDAVRDVIKMDVKVAFTTVELPSGKAPSNNNRPVITQRTEADPIINDALEIFEGEITGRGQSKARAK